MLRARQIFRFDSFYSNLPVISSLLIFNNTKTRNYAKPVRIGLKIYYLNLNQEILANIFKSPALAVVVDLGLFYEVPGNRFAEIAVEF